MKPEDAARIRAQMEADLAAGLDPYRTGQKNARGQTICGSRKAKSSNKAGGDLPCQNTAIASNGRCKHHGGKALSGPAHPNYKHGLFSSYFPAGFLPRYQALLSDPRALEVKEGMFALYARFAEVAERLNTGESAAAWADAGAAHRMIVEAMNEADPAKLRDGVQQLGRAVEEGAAHFEYEREIWKELRGLLDDHRKLAAEQNRINETMQQNISNQEMGMQLHILFGIIKEEADPDTVTRIWNRAYLHVIQRRAGVLALEGA